MPYDNDCFIKHRDGKNVDCKSCSTAKHYKLYSVNDFDLVINDISGVISNLSDWEENSATVHRLIRYMVWEPCINAVEHGVLGIGGGKKKRLQEKHRGKYWNHIENEWTKKNTPIGLSVCINRKRLLVGTHDPGRGFDFTNCDYGDEPLSDEKLMRSGGRGLSILKGLGISIHWNKKGNSVLCSLYYEKIKS